MKGKQYKRHEKRGKMRYRTETGDEINDEHTPHCYEETVSIKNVFEYARTLTDDPQSRTIMNEIHPSLKGDPSLPPQLLHRKLECFRGPFIIRHPLILSRSRK